jgi:hypothetical protein
LPLVDRAAVASAPRTRVVVVPHEPDGDAVASTSSMENSSRLMEVKEVPAVLAVVEVQGTRVR